MSQKSDSLTAFDASVIKALLILGLQQKRIAALFDVNQGRISEINRGKIYKTVAPNAQFDLPYLTKKKSNT